MSINDAPEKPSHTCDVQRLANIGRMTAHFAHQIRTPLTAAVLYAGNLENYSSVEGETLRCLRRIQECHASMEQQIHDLLLFAQGETLQRLPANIQSWGKKLSEKIDSLYCAPSAVILIDNQLPSMDCNIHEESLMGAVLNLVNNALQAGANRVNITMMQTLENVFHIRISDNGCGMSDEVKAQAFSPFFTNKPRGIGLGLAVVDAVVKAHGGEIVLDSTPLTGCCVTINLPGQV